MTSKQTAEASKLLLLAHGRLFIDAKSMHIERPTEQFQHQKLLDSCFFPTKGYDGVFFQTLSGMLSPFFNEAASIAASNLNRTTKMLRASIENGKMMLEVMLEAWGEKNKQKYVFPNAKT